VFGGGEAGARCDRCYGGLGRQGPGKRENEVGERGEADLFVGEEAAVVDHLEGGESLALGARRRLVDAPAVDHDL
jgi:hypothetical protein